MNTDVEVGVLAPGSLVTLVAAADPACSPTTSDSFAIFILLVLVLLLRLRD